MGDRKWGRKKEKRGLLLNNKKKEGVIIEWKRKRRVQNIRICKRYRGRGKYLILERPTPLTPVYANLLTKPAKEGSSC